MKRIVLAFSAALALAAFCDRHSHAFGLLDHGLFDHNACDESCDSGCVHGSPCCDDIQSFDGCSACDACGVCGQSGDDCGCLGRMKLLGCLKPSDHCFDDFISPMINFVFIEDPRTLTEVRPIFVSHQTPSRVGTLLAPGGSVQLYAMQIRLALTERLSLIAVKDGFIVERIKDGPLDDLLEDGFAAVSLGLKYNVLRDPKCGRIASVGFTYELPIGSRRALQDVADGEFHVFASCGHRLRNGNGHYLTSFGYRFPVDDDRQTSAFHWSNHFDYRLTKRVYFVSEFAWWHWTSSADPAQGLPLGVAGHDLFNLPATNVTGNDLVTKNFGTKFKPNRNLEMGIAYEFPLSNFQDIIKDRIQMDLILRY